MLVGQGQLVTLLLQPDFLQFRVQIFEHVPIDLALRGCLIQQYLFLDDVGHKLHLFFLEGVDLRLRSFGLLNGLGDNGLVLELLIVVLEYLAFLGGDFLFEAGDLCSEDFPLVLQLTVRLLQLYVPILQKHLHARHLLLELLPHLHRLVHGLLHLLLLRRCDGVEPLELVLDGLQVPDALVVVHDAGVLALDLLKEVVDLLLVFLALLG